MGKKTKFTTKEKLDILKEFGDFWIKVWENYFPEKIEWTVLLSMYDTLMDIDWVEEFDSDRLVEEMAWIFAPEYIEEFIERHWLVNQAADLFKEGIWFCYGLLSDDELSYEAVDNTRHIMEELKDKSDSDLSLIFRIVYWKFDWKIDKVDEEEKISDEDIKKIWEGIANICNK